MVPSSAVSQPLMPMPSGDSICSFVFFWAIVLSPRVDFDDANEWVSSP